jgi:hypothetical protein
MSRSLIAALRKLRQAPGGGLASSQLSEGQRRELSSFARATGSIQMRPEGRGVVFEIRLPAVVEHQWRQLVPIEQAELVDGLPRRARNIAATRRSKGADHGHEFSYLLLKAGPGQVAWRDDKDNRLDLRLSTDQLGVAALTVHADSTWYTEHPLWLVENQALFDQLDWLPCAQPASVAYYSGQLPNTLLDWLALRQRAPAIHFFPDYDGVGLLNFARLRSRLGHSVALWLMLEWPSRLERFGCTTLWQDTQREFNAMLAHPATADFDVEVKQLIRSMQASGMALEQEAVWL